jgi:hypothetical protein
VAPVSTFLKGNSMRWIKRVAIVLLVLLVVAIGGLFATGNGAMVQLGMGYLFGKPSGPFDPADAVAAPDYSVPENWAALPDRQDLADLVPTGISPANSQGSAPVDVFFIHPTGFLKGSSWTFTMDADTSTEENTLWMMANQASAYNGCCNVYAPRYRQASIYAYFSGEEVAEPVLAFAYQDVERAFDYFLEHFNRGRPFVIASHSQGTHHGIRLLQERIDGTRLADQLVAAFLIGGGLEKSEFAELRDVTVCAHATDTTCAVHWDTFSEAALDDPPQDSVTRLCVNPLSWEIDGGLAGKEQHAGAVPGSGEFHLSIMGDDSARGVEFGALGEPLVNFVEARCKNGRLHISDQSETRFGRAGALGANYHGLDYPIFHMDIRENVELRVRTYLAARRLPMQQTTNDEEREAP